MLNNRLEVITQDGFMRPTYDEVLQYLTSRVKERLHEKLNTEDGTIAGKIIRILAYDYAYIFEVMETVYFGRFPHHAEGTMLDFLMPFAGIIRNPPAAAEYMIRVFGEKDAVIEANSLQISTPPGDLIFENNDSFVINTMLNEEYYADYAFTCIEAGPKGNLPVEALNMIVSVDARVFSVEQREQVVVGREKESDFELRQRFDLAIKGVGSGTMPAVVAEVMRVANVLGVVIEENDTDSVVNGVPAHSFQTFVQHEAANDYAIATAILAKKPMGIKAFGDINTSVEDDYKNKHNIGFSRVKPIKLKLQLTVAVVFEEYSGNEAVAASIANYINGFPNGRDVVYNSIYPKAYAVAGVMDVKNLEISSDDGASWVSTNISVNAAHVAKLNMQDVEVKSVKYTDT